MNPQRRSRNATALTELPRPHVHGQSHLNPPSEDLSVSHPFGHPDFIKADEFLVGARRLGITASSISALHAKLSAPSEERRALCQQSFRISDPQSAAALTRYDQQIERLKTYRTHVRRGPPVKSSVKSAASKTVTEAIQDVRTERRQYNRARSNHKEAVGRLALRIRESIETHEFRESADSVLRANHPIYVEHIASRQTLCLYVHGRSGTSPFRNLPDAILQDSQVQMILRKARITPLPRFRGIYVGIQLDLNDNVDEIKVDELAGSLSDSTLRFLSEVSGTYVQRIDSLFLSTGPGYMNTMQNAVGVCRHIVDALSGKRVRLNTVCDIVSKKDRRFTPARVAEGVGYLQATGHVHTFSSGHATFVQLLRR